MQTGAAGDWLDRLVVIAHVVLVCTTSDRSLRSLSKKKGSEAQARLKKKKRKKQEHLTSL